MIGYRSDGYVLISKKQMVISKPSDHNSLAEIATVAKVKSKDPFRKKSSPFI